MLAPAPKRTPDQWADANRMLPKGSAEEGPYRSHRTPYCIPIARAFQMPGVQVVTGVMARQMAKTNGVVFNVVGQRLDDAPVPMAYFGETQDQVEDVIAPKVQEMLNLCESLSRKQLKGQKNKINHKIINGVSFRLGWAQSRAQLKADSLGCAFVDELDGITQRMRSGEGNPVDMAEALLSTYVDSTLGLFSTPTEGDVEIAAHPLTGMEHWSVSDAVVSPIWRYWQEGSRHEWSVPCSHCREYFIPRMKQLHWSGGETWKAEQSARMVCLHCGAEMNTHDREWMNLHGVMVAPGQRPRAYDDSPCVVLDDHTGREVRTTELELGDFQMPEPHNRNASFWVSGLMTFAQKKSWGYIAGKWVTAENSAEPERLQGVLNTDLGELYAVGGDAPRWPEVKAHCGEYKAGERPDWVRRITIGVDVQADRLPFVVRGWGGKFRSAQLEVGELYGDTQRQTVWAELLALLDTTEYGIPISKMCVDSGFRTNEVYEFCRQNRRAVPTKGHDRLAKPFYSTLPEVDHRGRKRPNGVELWHFDADVMKSWVHARIRGSLEEDPSYWELPSDTTEDYCRQLVSEQRVVQPSKRVVWIRVSRQNHWFDCEVLCYLAARLVAGRMRPVPGATAQELETPNPARRHRHKRSRGYSANKW